MVAFPPLKPPPIRGGFFVSWSRRPPAPSMTRPAALDRSASDPARLSIATAARSVKRSQPRQAATPAPALLEQNAAAARSRPAQDLAPAATSRQPRQFWRGDPAHLRPLPSPAPEPRATSPGATFPASFKAARLPQPGQAPRELRAPFLALLPPGRCRRPRQIRRGQQLNPRQTPAVPTAPGPAPVAAGSRQARRKRSQPRQHKPTPEPPTSRGPSSPCNPSRATH